MYEIELKAHVYDRQKTVFSLNKFAEFKRACQKTDTYWKHPVSDIQIRIREEMPLEYPDICSPGGQNQDDTIIVTYKSKELRKAQDGTSFEVNDEQEFTINTRLPFETFLKDAGFTVSIRKLKTVYQWQTDDKLIELCTVPPLGDFVEIEIQAESNMPHIVAAAQTDLAETLSKCGIDKKDIEPRYYSEMLAAQVRE